MAAQRIGRLLVAAMPKLLGVLASVGTLAMLWVGGGIILHGSEELGLHGPAALAHGVQHAVSHAAGPLSGILGWLSYAASSAAVGLILGALVAAAMHLVHKARQPK